MNKPLTSRKSIDHQDFPFKKGNPFKADNPRFNVLQGKRSLCVGYYFMRREVHVHGTLHLHDLPLTVESLETVLDAFIVLAVKKNIKPTSEFYRELKATLKKQVAGQKLVA